MYKLLLVTEDPKILRAFDEIKSWEIMGFRAPRIVSTKEEALDSLARHHADGIAYGLPEEEAVALTMQLIERYPLLPVMRAADTVELVRADVAELEQILNSTHADYSNDRYDEAEKMLLARHDYFRHVLAGDIHDADGMMRHLRLLRSRMDTDRACVLIQLGLPDDDGYLADHWRYGADRLEVAMRNIFGAELAGMRILVSVLPDERLFLLACPMFGAKAPALDEGMTDIVMEQTQQSIMHVREYLDIDLCVASVKVLPSLLALAEE